MGPGNSSAGNVGSRLSIDKGVFYKLFITSLLACIMMTVLPWACKVENCSVLVIYLSI